MASPPGLKSDKKRNKAPVIKSVSQMSRNNTFVMESENESDNSDEWVNQNGGGKTMQSSLKKKVDDRPAGFSTLIKRDFFNR